MNLKTPYIIGMMMPIGGGLIMIGCLGDTSSTDSITSSIFSPPFKWYIPLAIRVYKGFLCGPTRNLFSNQYLFFNYICICLLIINSRKVLHLYRIVETRGLGEVVTLLPVGQPPPLCMLRTSSFSTTFNSPRDLHQGSICS